MASSPAYLQLATELSDRYRHLDGGTRLPSENELAAEHGVSRITARAALQELEHRHLVRRQRGSGTFVATRIPYPVRSGMPPSWTAIVAAAGHQPSHRILSARIVRASAAVARTLLLPRGRTVVRIERLGLVDGEVASHHLSHVPSAVAPGLIDRLGDGSLSEAFVRSYGLEPDRWWSRAELSTLPGAIGGLLELSGRPQAWCIQSINVCRRLGQPIEATAGWLRADHFRVFLESGPADGRLDAIDLINDPVPGVRP